MILNPKKQLIGFTSDLHMFHKNVIKYSNRPFQDMLGMNEAIRDRHNSIFDKDAIVFNLGDALLVPRIEGERDTDPRLLKQAEDLIQTFNGKIHYLPGNHESQIDIIRKHWKVVPQIYEVQIEDEDTEKGKQSIVMCHYAFRVWSESHHGSWHVYGHSHAGLKNDFGDLMQDYEFTLSMDVGVDTNNYYPYTYEDIKKHMATKTFRASDHHSAKMSGISGADDLSK